MLHARADRVPAETRQAIELMLHFAERTGVTSPSPQNRNLWTDSFAVCNFLSLWQATDERYYLDCARRLVEQVHNTLGKHHPDDKRSGWISGLDEIEARRHPTRGGLRMGKSLPERKAVERHDRELESRRDGQHFHDLTRWMHALDRIAGLTADPQYHHWARELAEVAQRAFCYQAPESGRERMTWKMSTDLSRPLVRSMGQHDALEGYLACAELRATAAALSARGDEDLQQVQTPFERMTRSRSWATADPIGVGGLLVDACRSGLLAEGGLLPRELLPALLRAALSGLRLYVGRADFSQSKITRIGFRELGLSIGLAAIERLEVKTEREEDRRVRLLLKEFQRYTPLRSKIEDICLDPAHRKNRKWMEHYNLNEVMLAASLVPELRVFAAIEGE